MGECPQRGGTGMSCLCLPSGHGGQLDKRTQQAETTVRAGLVPRSETVDLRSARARSFWGGRRRHELAGSCDRDGHRFSFVQLYFKLMSSWGGRAPCGLSNWRAPFNSPRRPIVYSTRPFICSLLLLVSALLVDAHRRRRIF